MLLLLPLNRKKHKEQSEGFPLSFMFQEHKGKAMWDVQEFPKSGHSVNVNIIDRYEQKYFFSLVPMYIIVHFLIYQILLVKSRLVGIQKVNAHLTNTRRFCKITSGLCTADQRLWSIF